MRPTHPATREKDLGIWQTWTWSQVADDVRALACGLAAQGFRRGMHLAIIGDNRPRLYWSMIAAQALGGMPVPMYQDAPAAEFVYVLNDAEIAYAVVEDQEQVDKMLEAMPQVPTLEHIYYDDPRGLRNYEGVTSFDRLLEIGREFDRAHPGLYDAEVAKGAPDDVSVMLYTSGTTGKPKGVRQTHRAFIAAAEGGATSMQLGPDDSMLSYLPMAWVGDHLFSFAQWMVAGFTINCPESGETVMTDLREIGPTYYFAPPRVFENLLTQVMIRMEDASAIKRARSTISLRLRAAAAPRSSTASRSSLSDRLQYRIGNMLVYAPAAQRARHEPDPRRLHGGRGDRSGPVPLLSLDRHQSEAALRLDRDLRVRVPAAGRRRPFDTVGKPAPGVEVKIGGNGEVLVRGPMLLKEYYKRPDATAESIDAEGYFHTGDAGVHRRGRAAQDHRSRQGCRQARGRRDVRAELHREQAQVLSAHQGSRRVRQRHATASARSSTSTSGRWATGRNAAASPYSGYTDLAAKPEVYKLIGECVETGQRRARARGRARRIRRSAAS